MKNTTSPPIPGLIRTLGITAIVFSSLTPTAICSAEPKRSGVPNTAANRKQDETKQRLREGTKITEWTGDFIVRGDRATFRSADGKHTLRGIENLNLERIVRMLRENPEQKDWVVSGIITEYRGANYLLITSAVRKHKASGANDRPLNIETPSTNSDPTNKPPASSARG